ncbi:MAG TPA: MarR family winged helix-turn-helix transcriptional regulator [Polyangiales bacterium]|nr:MarR family winged helix-turn-helix transcriptional regulator [Polyangiales bacterium]
MSQPASAEPDSALDFGVLLEFLGFQVRRAQLRIYEDFARDAPVDGITPGLLAILVFIERNPGLTQQRLCESLGIDKSTLAVTLHRLCDRGLVKRVRSRRDRRENALELTDKGERARRSMLAHVASHERRIARHLTRAERQTLMRLLRKVAR